MYRKNILMVQNEESGNPFTKRRFDDNIIFNEGKCVFYTATKSFVYFCVLLKQNTEDEYLDRFKDCTFFE